MTRSRSTDAAVAGLINAIAAAMIRLIILATTIGMHSTSN